MELPNPDTLCVTWSGKFNGQPVTINAADFNPAIHTRVDEETAPSVPDAPPQRRRRERAQ